MEKKIINDREKTKEAQEPKVLKIRKKGKAEARTRCVQSMSCQHIDQFLFVIKVVPVYLVYGNM